MSRDESNEPIYFKEFYPLHYTPSLLEDRAYAPPLDQSRLQDHDDFLEMHAVPYYCYTPRLAESDGSDVTSCLVKYRNRITDL